MHVPHSKTHQLKFKNAGAVSKQKGLITVVEDPDDVLCPVAVMEHCALAQHPSATATCEFCPQPCSDGEKQRENATHKKSTILHMPGSKGPHDTGESKMPTLFKELARICGESNWDQCTGHGLRRHLMTCLIESGMNACDIATVVRHSSLNSQLHWAKLTGKRATARTAAVEESETGASHKKKKTKAAVPVTEAPPIASPATDEVTEPHAPSALEKNQFSQHPVAVQAPAQMKVEASVAAAPVHKTTAPTPAPASFHPMQGHHQAPRWTAPPPSPPPSFPGFPQSLQFRSSQEEVSWRRSQMNWAQQCAPTVEVHQPPPPREARMARSASFDARSQGGHSSHGSLAGSGSEASLQGNPDCCQNHHGENQGRF